MSLLALSRRFLTRRYSSTYKAAILEKYDKPLVIKDIKTPSKLKKGEAIIRVHYCSLNASDILLTQGVNPTNYALPIVPGFEIAGVVKEVNDCKDVGKGDKVVALSKEHLGGLAQECIVSENDIWLLPSNTSLDSASALIHSFGHAMLGLAYQSKLAEKQIVLATFAPAHGYAALDLAANVYKAKVIGVCLTEDDTENLRERGAWSTLAYNEKQLLGVVNDLTKGKGVDVVYDTFAGDILKTCLKCVRHEGNLIVAGYTLKEFPPISLSQMLALPSFSITGASLSSYRKHAFKVYRRIVSDVLELKEQNLISPVISSIHPLSKVNEALEIVKKKNPIGKIVIEVDK